MPAPSGPIDQRRYLIPFRSMLLPHILTDTLVIGSGVAGCQAALAAAGHGEVIILRKGAPEDSSTAWAQGGIAAALGPDDDVDHHVADTLAAGDGFCDERAVRVLCAEGPDRVAELIEGGMRFDRGADERLDLGREGGHQRDRILHADGAATGAELMRSMEARVEADDRIRVFDRCYALDLLTDEPDARVGAAGGRVLGAITHHPRYGLQVIWARATVLACGGAGRLFRETTNPHTANGDGQAMAHRAGAELVDLEFTQFHPTTLYVAGASRALISEAVRGEGVHLVDRQGHRFMASVHEMAELAPRDVVSRAIVEQLARSQEPAVFLDARHLPAGTFARRFPTLARTLAAFDLDAGTDLVPVHPSAHYTIGGIACDLDGRTSLPGLYACGEVAGNGVHGANRLASNSLLDGLVFGRRAGLATAETAGRSVSPMRVVSEIPVETRGELDITDVRSSLRSAMWRNVGILRSDPQLTDMLEMIDFWARYTLDRIFEEPLGWETQNMLTTAWLMTRAARWRTESRGVHYRLDHPGHDDGLLVRARWRRGAAEPELAPVTAGEPAEPAELPA